MSNESMARAIRDVGISPNEADRNSEPANIVDGLFDLGRAIRFAAEHVGEGLARISSSIETLAEVLDGVGAEVAAVHRRGQPR